MSQKSTLKQQADWAEMMVKETTAFIRRNDELRRPLPDRQLKLAWNDIGRDAHATLAGLSAGDPLPIEQKDADFLLGAQSPDDAAETLMGRVAAHGTVLPADRPLLLGLLSLTVAA